MKCVIQCVRVWHVICFKLFPPKIDGSASSHAVNLHGIWKCNFAVFRSYGLKLPNGLGWAGLEHCLFGIDLSIVSSPFAFGVHRGEAAAGGSRRRSPSSPPPSAPPLRRAPSSPAFTVSSRRAVSSGCSSYSRYSPSSRRPSSTSASAASTACARGSAGGSRARPWCARTAATPPTRFPTRWKRFGWLWTRGSTAWRWTSRGPPTACSSRCTTGRDLQKMSGDSTAKVGHWSTDEIKALSTRFQLSKSVRNEDVPKAEDALAMISQSVRQVILDVKVGPPSFEKGLAEDVLSLLKRINCKNCLLWAKSDDLGREMIKLSKDVVVGYIVMVDKSTGRRIELVRLEGAKVAGVYHHLIHEKVMKVMRRHDKKVFAWTVDDTNSMEKMLSEHVDAIVTSNPSLLQQLMHETRTECMEDGFALP
ncbi:uncharacterized protein LOC120644019 isoform X1 [Panicum virgatum]|uniref:uncharacterized protein LOC120644019 isoform X1 n=1 Tax=Panicum virgatum TaxID=38727 RepID=UPI0019D5776C|nr:uncharacterized protein LOC120644019 isoform X1 [Panicum virgatum]